MTLQTARPTDFFAAHVRELNLAPKGAAAGTFAGYGCVFNQLNYGDVVAPGAFANTLKRWQQRGKLPPMLSQHGGMAVTADDMTPVGEWTEMREDDVGLYVEGRLFALDTDRGKLLHEGLKAGVLDGMSIGFVPITVRYGQSEDEPDRTLLDVDLWELSLVTFPRQSNARVLEAHSAALSPRDIERALRPLMSRNRARYWAGVLSSDPDRASATLADQRCDAGDDEMAALLQAARSRLDGIFEAEVVAAIKAA